MRNDYLSKYNLAIRYMFIWFLNQGYDIYQDKVHPTFSVFIQQHIGIDKYLAEKIVRARHQMKYRGIIPAKHIYSTISDCIEKLKEI